MNSPLHSHSDYFVCVIYIIHKLMGFVNKLMQKLIMGILGVG